MAIDYCSEDTRPAPRAGIDCYYFCGAVLQAEADRIRAVLRKRGAWNIKVQWCDTERWDDRFFDVEWVERVDDCEVRYYEPVHPNPAGPVLV